MIPGTAVPRRIADAVLGNPLNEDLLLLDLRTGRFLGLGGVALAVWGEIDGVRTLGEIQATIAARYDVDRATCFAEVAAFVGDLCAQGIVGVD